MFTAGDENETEEIDDVGVVPCAQAFVTSGAFAQPDVELYDDNRFPTTDLCVKMKPWRGELKLLAKDRPIDSACKQVTLLEPFFASQRAATLRFFSAFTGTPGSDDDLQDTKCVEPSSNQTPVVRVERIVKHTVTLGCMRQAKMRLSKADALWNLHWGARFTDDSDFCKLLAFQKVNHFPGTWVLGRKDALARHLRLANQKHKDGGFDTMAPVTYTWPIDLPLIQRDLKDGFIFIAKPPARARGEGISLFRGVVPSWLQEIAKEKSKSQQPTTTKVSKSPAIVNDDGCDDDGSDAEDSDEENEVIIQRYFHRPLRINGYKVDLRVYVVCTSFDPLRLYVFNDGLVRFAAEPYPTPEALPSSLHEIYRHLTNYSVNKKSANYRESENDGQGSKWSFHALKRYFQSEGWCWDDAWQEVHDVIIKTFLAVEGTVCSKASTVKHRFNCFELYGFDILLDEDRKGHLIEVNVMPSLACGAAIDKHIKGHMIADLLTLVGIPFVDKVTAAQEAELAREERRSGVAMERSYSLQNNLESKPVKFDAKKWLNGAEYFAKHATEDDKAVLRDFEEEKRRRGGYQCIFPTSTSLRRFGHLFDTVRHYNRLLLTWEEWKSKSKSQELDDAVRWLSDQGGFPQKLRAKRSMSSAPPEVPRVASIAAKSRVSSSPRVVTQRPVTLPPVDKKSIPVCLFTFVAVPKK